MKASLTDKADVFRAVTITTACRNGHRVYFVSAPGMTPYPVYTRAAAETLREEMRDHLVRAWWAAPILARGRALSDETMRDVQKCRGKRGAP